MIAAGVWARPVEDNPRTELQLMIRHDAAS